MKRVFETGDASLISADLRAKVQRALTALDAAKTVRDLNLPGYRLHPLKGELKGWWSITITGNWRIIFQFSDSNAFLVDLIDYH